MDSASRRMPPAIRAAVDYGPLLVFVVVNKLAGGFAPATAALMVTVTVGLATAWHFERRLPTIPLFTAVLVLGFGALTLALDDERFIQLKPTAIYILFAGLLLGGLALGRSPLAAVMGEHLELDAQGWRALTRRAAFFCLAMAGVNEVARRVLSWDAWVDFKVFGSIALTFAFFAAQGPLLKRHATATESEPAEDAGGEEPR